MTAQCTPITQQCLPNVQWPTFADNADNTAYFNCSSGFQGNFSFPGAAQSVDADSSDSSGGADVNTNSLNPTIGMSFASDANLTRRIGAYNPLLSNISIDSVSALRGSNLSYEYIQPQNPSYFGAWAAGFPTYTAFLNNQTAPMSNVLLNDSRIYRSPSTGNTYWVLPCSATVHEFNYTRVNGSISDISHRPASPEMAALFAAPFAVDGIAVARQQLVLSAIEASTAYGMQSLADRFATNWVTAALDLSTAVMQKDNALVGQSRTFTGPVARVPMLPLYLLLTLKALYVVAVILLAMGAYCFTHPAETELIKEQLSANGLAAAHFDDPGILQKNASSTLEEVLLPTPTIPDEKTGGATRGSSGKEGEEPVPGVTKTVTGLDEMTEKRVGLVARADGAWRFAVIANGMWNGIKPIAVDLIGIEAKNGNLAQAGDLITAWRK
ncbi:hypothetical protein LTR78_001765 [Recurvomyces mirabilis]|uniref:Uncharacterized protein n=1 Tax=Recurvomyces mirabilis TaxID=574656 RepID=A0AAE1C548_9PEZI|nr:hypothetical protein LTR78_001765 [Recurvomyces mirabilis]KAK5150160.1 hypothetical protein LTS14_010289 [Recurvomyces mirabilis]